MDIILWFEKPTLLLPRHSPLEILVLGSLGSCLPQFEPAIDDTHYQRGSLWRSQSLEHYSTSYFKLREILIQYAEGVFSALWLKVPVLRANKGTGISKRLNDRPYIRTVIVINALASSLQVSSAKHRIYPLLTPIHDQRTTAPVS